MFLCKKCGESNEMNFYYSNRTKCKECVKKDVKANRLANIDKIREYDRTRPNHKERIAKNAERIKNNPELLKKYRQKQKEWTVKNKHKKQANDKVARALLKGILIRPTKCSKCDNTDIQAHHEDYAKPLDVIWLCVTCHNQRHKELRELARALTLQQQG